MYFLNIQILQFMEENSKRDAWMKENQASFTAMAVAYMRAYHAIHATDKIFNDTLACDLIPADKRALI